MHIIPAIIPESYEDLEEKLSEVRSLVSKVQIDICDGKFTPSSSWPYYRGHYSDDFQAILKEEEGMPLWQEFDFEIHLMVRNPFDVVMDWVSAGATGIVIQLNALPSEEFKAQFEKLRSQFPKGQSEGINLEIGLAINPDIPNDALLPYLEDIDFVQFMGSSNIGFHGVVLDESIFPKMRDFKNNHPEIPISVDIGVTLENAELLKNEGADRLVSGSAIFHSDNIVETIENFKAI